VAVRPVWFLLALVSAAASWAEDGEVRKVSRMVPERVGDRFGFATWSGRAVILPHFDMVTPFRDGRAAAMRNGKWGFLDEDGRWVGQPKYDWVHPQHFDEGPALVSANGLYGYVDYDGREVIALSLESAEPFVGGYACVRPPDAGGLALVGEDGRALTPSVYEDCDPRFSAGLARIRRGGLWGFVDATGTEVLPPRYDRAEAFSEGLALVEESGLRAYVDAAGRRVVPANVESSGSFSQGRAWMKWGPDQVGFIDASGARVGEARWRAAQDFREGVAWVQDPNTGRWGLIGLDGAVVLRPTWEDPGIFAEGLARVSQQGKYGFVDTRGRVVVPLRFESVGSRFREGLVSVSSQRGGKQGVVDRDGLVVVEERYDEVGEFYGGVATVTRCRWEPRGVLGHEVQVCETFYLDRDGRERWKTPSP
jgi:hypothetical protein